LSTKDPINNITHLTNELKSTRQRLATCHTNAEAAKQAASLAAEKRGVLESELANQLSEPTEEQLAALRLLIEAEAEHRSLATMANNRVTRAAAALKAADESLRAAEADASEAWVWELGSGLAAEMAPFAGRFELFGRAVSDLRRYGRTVTFLPNLAPLFAWVAEFQKAETARRNPRPAQKADPRGQVTFIRSTSVEGYSNYGKDETAGFDPETAAMLVCEGHARWTVAHEDHEGLLSKAKSWLATLRRPTPSNYYGTPQQAKGIDL
jgi:hypothetical protein